MGNILPRGVIANKYDVYMRNIHVSATLIRLRISLQIVMEATASPARDVAWVKTAEPFMCAVRRDICSYY